MENFIVSARKYRPASFDMVVGQDSITSTLKNAIKNNKLAHAYLFCGPRGVGKTTCARIFAKTINCTNLRDDFEACDECESCVSFNTLRSFNIHELDAASNNKVEDIRSLNEQVRIPPQIGKYSIYIIDEVHMLSSSAFNAFLKTLEEPPAHAIFILATTEKHKIIPTILSRCQIFDFNRIRVEDIINRLMFVAKRESVNAEEEALHIIAQKADGAMRDALSIFDQIASLCGKSITYADVIANLNVLDFEYYFRTVDGLISGDISSVLMIFNEILEKGFDGHNFIAGLNSHLRDLLVSKDEATLKLLETTTVVRKRYLNQTAGCPVDFLYSALDLGAACDINYKSSKNQRLHVELALIRMCRLKNGNGSSATAEKKKPDTNRIVNGEEDLPQPAEGEPARKIAEPEGRKFHNSAPSKVNVPVSHIPELEKPVKSFSIKDLISDNTNAPVKSEGAGKVPMHPDQTEKIAFSDGAFRSVWKDFLETLNGEGLRITSMFKGLNIEVGNGKIILIHLDNEAQKDLFVQDYKQRLAVFLGRRFDITEVNIETVVDEAAPENILYSDDQKLTYLMSKYPVLKEMKKTFNLDIT
jgi:DNA polymerase-3 subunit gamma/tau